MRKITRDRIESIGLTHDQLQHIAKERNHLELFVLGFTVKQVDEIQDGYGDLSNEQLIAKANDWVGKTIHVKWFGSNCFCEHVEVREQTEKHKERYGEDDIGYFVFKTAAGGFTSPIHYINLDQYMEVSNE